MAVTVCKGIFDGEVYGSFRLSEALSVHTAMLFCRNAGSIFIKAIQGGYRYVGLQSTV